MRELVIIRGGGDLASGVIQKFHRSGIPILVLESKNPSFIRRKVSYGEAVYGGEILLEGSRAKYLGDADENLDWDEIFTGEYIPLITDPGMKIFEVIEKYNCKKEKEYDKVKIIALIDAIIAKKNLGVKRDLAPITIGLGPGFYAGKDVDVVIETMRGHNLGKLILEGEALPNTGIPGMVGGESHLRVIYSDYEGRLKITRDIGEIVQEGEVIAEIGNNKICAKISGVIRGMIRGGYPVKKGMKIADIDSRKEEQKNCFTLSDKARALGGSALEAYLYLRKTKKI
ncbi:MAG: selenium-dependent molybdenum cofactor biosynthesis protein YqeB [Fusobacteriaceae bacterium]